MINSAVDMLISLYFGRCAKNHIATGINLLIKVTEYLQVLESSLQLSAEELAGLQTIIVPKKSGLISYEEFASQSTDVISSLYKDQPESDKHWVELKAYDGSMVVSYNKQTGEIK